VTRGAVYWHVRDKADLLGALCERANLPLEAMMEGDCAGGDPLQTLRDGAIAVLRHLAGDARAQSVFQLMFQNCGAGEELALLESTRERERGACLARIETLVARATAAGQLPADTDAVLTAHALHAFVVGLMTGWVRHPQSYDLAADAPALVEAMLCGLRAAPLRRARNQAAATANAP
jgi:TetR/AcrR family acrAB operon transcriptional repressor